MKVLLFRHHQRKSIAESKEIAVLVIGIHHPVVGSRLDGLGHRLAVGIRLIDPDGEVLATTSDARPFVTMDIDLSKAYDAKKTYPRDVKE